MKSEYQKHKTNIRKIIELDEEINEIETKKAEISDQITRLTGERSRSIPRISSAISIQE